MAYESLALMAPACPADILAIESRIRHWIPECRVDRDGGLITLTARDGWSLRLVFSDGPWVIEESADIVKRFGSQRSDAANLARAARGLEIAADDDPEMDHFNDFVFVTQALDEIGGIAVFDTGNCVFLDDY